MRQSGPGNPEKIKWRKEEWKKETVSNPAWDLFWSAPDAPSVSGTYGNSRTSPGVRRGRVRIVLPVIPFNTGDTCRHDGIGRRTRQPQERHDGLQDTGAERQQMALARVDLPSGQLRPHDFTTPSYPAGWSTTCWKFLNGSFNGMGPEKVAATFDAMVADPMNSYSSWA